MATLQQILKQYSYKSSEVLLEKINTSPIGEVITKISVTRNLVTNEFETEVTTDKFKKAFKSLLWYIKREESDLKSQYHGRINWDSTQRSMFNMNRADLRSAKVKLSGILQAMRENQII